MTVTADQVQASPQRQRQRTPLIALAIVLGALAIFAVAFLVSHHGQPKAPAAKVVDAKIAPGPSAASLKSEFATKISPLAKAPVHKKKAKKKASSSSSSASSAASSSSSSDYGSSASETPAYTPPASTSSGGSSGSSSSSSHSSGSSSGSSKAPSGGGVITIG